MQIEFEERLLCRLLRPRHRLLRVYKWCLCMKPLLVSGGSLQPAPPPGSQQVCDQRVWKCDQSTSSAFVLLCSEMPFNAHWHEAALIFPPRNVLFYCTWAEWDLFLLSYSHSRAATWNISGPDLCSTHVRIMYVLAQVDIRDTFRNFSSLSSGHLCSLRSTGK